MADLPPFVRVHPEGFTIAVRVTPKASSEGIGPIRGTELTVKVRVAPEDGKATAAVIEVVAKKLGCPKSAIELLKGATSRSKVLLARVTSADVSRLNY